MKNGFTLAEVLITLVIIGIIAAMTIPTLINKTNEQDTVVQVKKAYSTISQAYQRVIAEDGEIIPTTLGTNQQDYATNIGEMFAKQLNVLENCGITNNGNCFATGYYKRFNGTNQTNYNAQIWLYKMRLNDGMSIALAGLSNYGVARGTSEPLKNVISFAHVDINGDKEPNTYGKDLFVFYITKYGIVPQGTSEETMNPLSKCRDTGDGCTAWVVTKGNVDYWKKDVSW